MKLVDVKAKYFAEKKVKGILENLHESERSQVDEKGLYQDTFKIVKAKLIGFKGIIMGGGFDGGQPQLEPVKLK
jgi:hypothetical protein